MEEEDRLEVHEHLDWALAHLEAQDRLLDHLELTVPLEEVLRLVRLGL